jgi:HEAT repeat protein
MPDISVDERVRTLLLVEHFDARARGRLRDLGDVALEGLRACALGGDRGEQAVLKSRALVALGDWPDDAALETLERALVDRRLDTRLRAATALGDQGSVRAVDALARRARGGVADGAELATIARSLARIDRPEAASALAEVRSDVADAAVRRQVDLATEGG